MIAVAQVAVRVVQSFMLPNPSAVFRQQRQRLFVGFTQLRAIFTEFKWLIGEKIRPRTSSASANGWQRFSQLYGAPCATTPSTAARQSANALVTAGTTCSGLIAEKGGSEKDVSNGLVICAVL